MYTCPVCGNDTLRSKPYENWPPPPETVITPPYEDALGQPSYEVCPVCGYEFGFDDNPGNGSPQSFEEYRREWESSGSRPFSPGTGSSG